VIRWVAVRWSGSNGGDEICHFLEWVDFSGNGVQPPVAPLTDPTNGLTFPNFDATPNPLLQTNLIFPVPCEFISLDLPRCAAIRPTGQGQIDAVGPANFPIGEGLFIYWATAAVHRSVAQLGARSRCSSAPGIKPAGHGANRELIPILCTLWGRPSLFVFCHSCGWADYTIRSSAPRRCRVNEQYRV